MTTAAVNCFTSTTLTSGRWRDPQPATFGVAAFVATL
jgi:hypothetical protein